jgi:hypothetical protein
VCDILADETTSMNQDLQPKTQTPRKELPSIRLTWDSTTVPQTPVSLPIAAQVQVTADGLDIHAVRKGSIAADEAAVVHIPKEQIIGIDVYLMPDIPDDTDPSWHEGQESYAVVRHADPFEVVPFFESKLSSDKAYWLKALTKAARERLGVEAKVTEETQRTRKLRWIRERDGQ